MKKFNLIVGSMLHDIGKVIYRGNTDGRNHSISGYDFLKESFSNADESMLHCVRYHHADELKSASLKKDDIAYITYIADNISSFIDRRTAVDSQRSFVKDKPFQSVFNILNGNHSKFNLSPRILDSETEINFPSEKSTGNFDTEFYNRIKIGISDFLKNYDLSFEYTNSLLSILEGYLSYIPSSTNDAEYCDISLFDHIKITTAIACCLYDYLNENDLSDFSLLFSNCEKYYEKEFMLLYSLDVSGIQNFIYTISSKGALKGLRARSFYLELLLENSIDCLLERLELSRSNLLYLGGGHCYLILPNTQFAKNVVCEFENEINEWLISKYKNTLYIASGYKECTPNNFRNQPQGSYSELFKNVSAQISKKKATRYSAEQIIELNKSSANENIRECVVCGATDNLDDTDKCKLCSNLEKISSKLIDNKNDSFFLILKSPSPDSDSVELPFNQYLSILNKEDAVKAIKADEIYIRCYSKNKLYSGMNVSSKIWLGDYSNASSFKELAQNCTGIKRLGVIRADIDNLGQAFVNGFEEKSVSISRTSTFSRSLSLFFKYYINGLLKNGCYQITDKTENERNATIVYSGGDDLFIVGSWDDIICFSIDLYNTFSKFTEKTLSISAGIGIFSESFPIIAMAKQTGKLEDCSKHYDNDSKNAVTLFENDGSNTYHWDEFINGVLEEKYKLIREYFSDNEESGKSLLYKMLELIRSKNDTEKLNIAKFAYLLARLKPKHNAAALEKYQNFSSKMYDWIQDTTHRKQLVTAIYIYIYSIRDKEN